MINWWQSYRLRLRRKHLLWRSFRSRHSLTSRSDRTRLIAPGAILAFSTVRNEIFRLPWFFRHYRALGVDHFLMVDNGSDDGTTEYLQDQHDVSLWHTEASYRGSRFGLDWLTWLQIRYGQDHWSLMVDADELLIYPHHDTRDLHKLTLDLERRNRRVFGALMLDLYPKGPIGDHDYDPGSNPTDLLQWFDAGPYRAERQAPLGNLWVQGGVRDRVFFADRPQRAPTLNKIPLIRWSRKYAYVNSSHSALPRPLNFGYDGPGGQGPSGALLHTKFLPQAIEAARTEKLRRQHFHSPEHFEDYYDSIIRNPDLWTTHSVQLNGWQQLQALGLMHSGD